MGNFYYWVVKANNIGHSAGNMYPCGMKGDCQWVNRISEAIQWYQLCQITDGTSVVEPTGDVQAKLGFYTTLVGRAFRPRYDGLFYTFHYVYSCQLDERIMEVLPIYIVLGTCVQLSQFDCNLLHQIGGARNARKQSCFLQVFYPCFNSPRVLFCAVLYCLCILRINAVYIFWCILDIDISAANPTDSLSKVLHQYFFLALLAHADHQCDCLNQQN